MEAQADTKGTVNGHYTTVRHVLSPCVCEFLCVCVCVYMHKYECVCVFWVRACPHLQKAWFCIATVSPQSCVWVCIGVCVCVCVGVGGCVCACVLVGESVHMHLCWLCREALACLRGRSGGARPVVLRGVFVV